MAKKPRTEKPTGSTVTAYRVPDESDDLHILLRARMKEMMGPRWGDLSASEQIRLVATVARVETLYPKIQEGSYAATLNRGSTVRQYEKAFAANAARQRGEVPGDGVAGILGDENDELEY